MIFHSLVGSATPPSSIFNMISRSLLQAKRFSECECKFSFVPREGNRVVHGLAKYARNLLESSSRIEETPCIIEQVVSQDVLFLSSSQLNEVVFIIKKEKKKRWS